MKKKYLLAIVCAVFSIACATTPFVTPLIMKIEEATERFLVSFGWVTSPLFGLVAVLIFIIPPKKPKRYFDFLKDDEFEGTEYDDFVSDGHH